jgi:hypothetical protein
MNELFRQAQIMQKKIATLQEEMGNRQVEASAGGGMVTVKATAKQEILSITIDPAVVDPEDVGMLQDLIAAAVNEAVKKGKDLMQEEMSAVTGGINLPGIF